MVEDLVALLIPIFICVVLPVAIVFIVFRASMNSDNKRAEVLIKAIEANNDIDTDKLAEAMKKPVKPVKTERQILNQRLLRGCIFTLIGLFLSIIGIYNYATLSPEISNDSATVPTIFGGIFLAIGISYLIVYFVTRKQVESEK